MARPIVSLAVGALLLCACPAFSQGGGGSSSPPCGTDQVEVTGRVLRPASPNDPGGGPFPVPCCDVLVEALDPATGETLIRTITETDGEGVFETCLDCPPGGPGFVTVQATPQCCAAPFSVVPDVNCDGGEADMGDFLCEAQPQTSRTLLEGRTVCRDGTFTEPVPDCSMLVSAPDGASLGVTETEEDGDWEICVDCADPTGGVDQVVVEAQCCGVTRDSDISNCPERQPVDTHVCDDCPVFPCADPRDVEILGEVRCIDGTPVPDCPVDVFISGCGVQEVRRPITDQDGIYRECVDCPGNEDCAAWSVQAVPTCCDAGEVFEQVDGCPPREVLELLTCLDPVGCPPPSPCPPGEAHLEGVVSCDEDGDTVPEPIEGCRVRADGCQQGPLFATTDASGGYSFCLPCAECASDIQVTAECCGETRLALTTCDATTIQDIDCVDCPPPPGPCGTADEVLVRGSLDCKQAGGLAPPIAGCPVELTGRDASGQPTSTETTVSDGRGDYEACLACGPDGLAAVEAFATCCGGSSETPLQDCPPEAELETITCPDCAPCPDGFTRVQGRIHCRGSGPVEGCPVRLLVETCSGIEEFELVSDAEGKYLACVPCPCSGGDVRVIAECCDLSRTLEDPGCGPIAPVPTLFCRAGCP